MHRGKVLIQEGVKMHYMIIYIWHNNFGFVRKVKEIATSVEERDAIISFCNEHNYSVVSITGYLK